MPRYKLCPVCGHRSLRHYPFSYETGPAECWCDVCGFNYQDYGPTDTDPITLWKIVDGITDEDEARIESTEFGGLPR